MSAHLQQGIGTIDILPYAATILVNQHERLRNLPFAKAIPLKYALKAFPDGYWRQMKDINGSFSPASRPTMNTDTVLDEE